MMALTILVLMADSGRKPSALTQTSALPVADSAVLQS
jgi:hypothetical protein